MAHLRRIFGLLRETGEELLVELAVSHGMVPPDQVHEAETLASLAARGLVTPAQLAELRRLGAARDRESLRAESPPPEVLEARRDPGRILGRYTLVTAIGRGGAGTVWRAWDGDLRRWVAVKRPQDPVSEIFRQRFVREGRIVAGLRHPHLVAMHDVGELQGRPYLVMDLAPGKPLEVTRDQRLMADVLRKVALAMEEVHRHGIVHRDLKPDNIVVDQRGEPIVVDFGLAQVADPDVALTRTGATMGTPLYMAPEQVDPRFGPTSPRTDVYALGAILYQALTGRPPHIGFTAAEIYRRILDVDPVRPRSINPLAGVELEAVCLKAIEKEPSKRYASASELAEELRRWLEGQPVLARPSTTFRRFGRRLQRNPGAWSLGTGAVLLAILGAAVARNQWTRLSIESKEDRRRADLASWANEVSAAYYDVSGRSLLAMRRLEDRWHASRPDPGEELAEIEVIVRDASSRWPRLRLPKAWRGLAHFYAGRDAAGLSEMEAACSEAGQDPFPHVLLARARLAAYVREADLPAIEIGVGSADVSIGLFAESAAMKQNRERAAQSLKLAAGLSVWKELREGRDVEAYAEGADLLGRREFEAAAAKLSQVTLPGFKDEASVLRGLALFERGESGEAAAAWEEAGRRWIRALGFAGVTRLRSGTTEWKAGRPPLGEFDAAIRDFDTLIAALPASAPPRRHRAIAHLYRGQHDIAAGRDPQSSFQAAQDDSDEAVRLDDAGSRPLRGLVHLHIARLLSSRGSDATARFQLALADLPASQSGMRALAWLERGQNEAALGRPSRDSFQQATDAFATAIANEPRDPSLRLNRANALMGLADAATREGADAIPFLEKAITDYDDAFRLDPKHAGPLGNRALTHFQIGELLLARGLDPRERFRSAVRDLDKAIAMDRSPLYLGNRAEIQRRWAECELATQGDATARLEMALADANEAIRGAPRDGQHYASRARIHVLAAHAAVARGENPDAHRQDALRDLTDAVNLRANFWEAHAQKAALLDVLGRPKEALEEVDKALQIVPHNAWLKALRDRLRAKQ